MSTPCNPCGTPEENSAACELLPSQIENFTLQFFGSVIKTEVDGAVQWSLPCNLDVGLPANPRGATEPLGCYFLRLFDIGITGVEGEKGPKGDAGEDGTNAYTTLAAAFKTPSLASPVVQVSTVYNPAIVEGLNIFIPGSGWYLIDGTDGQGVLFLTLLTLVSNPTAIPQPGTLVIPAGATGAGVQGPRGLQGVKGAPGEPGPKGEPGEDVGIVTATNGDYYVSSGTDFAVVSTDYQPVDFTVSFARLTLPTAGTYLLVAKTAVNSGSDIYVKLRNDTASEDITGTEQLISPSGVNEFRHCPMTAIYTTSADAQVVSLYARKGALGFLDGGLTGANNAVQAVAVQDDGKVLIAGQFTNVNSVVRNRIARLNANGTLDTGFQNAIAGANGIVRAMVLAADGRVIIAGDFTQVNGVAMQRVARLNATDGSLDVSFPNPLVNSSVYDVRVAADGKILIGGLFTTVNGVARTRIARLNDDGTLDAAFGVGLAGANANVQAIYVQADGKILIGGNFTSVNSTARNRIARLEEADGSLDATFLAVGTGANNVVQQMVVQADGSVVLVGLFTSVNGTARSRVARVNSVGVLDAGFNAGTIGGATPEVDCVALDAAENVIIGGKFATVGGVTRLRVARLAPDGTLDTTFQNTNGDGGIFSVAVQTDGRIVVGGNFLMVDSIAHHRIARFNADGTLDTIPSGAQTVAALYTDLAWVKINE